tara:strand:- start:579 stop:1343 length:765 start_codon:yes stop_codon:yes gene_type:complete
MHLQNKKHKSTDLSILIFRDGFSFCTQKKTCFYPINEYDKIDQKKLSDWINKQEFVTTNVFLIYLDSLSTIVPEELFDKENASFYVKNGIAPSKNQEVLFDVLESFNQVVVFVGIPSVEKVFKELFPDHQSQHLTSFLLAPLSRFSMGTSKKQFFVHLRKGYFDLFLFRGTQLLLFNTFEQNHADEFLYYLLYIIEQFYLKPESFKLAFLGEYECYKEYYQGIQEYHNDVVFIDAPSENRNSRHPAPFLENKIA